MKFGFVGWFPAPVAFLDHEMISRLKTPVAVLRQMLGLSVEDFGKLIGKSLSTVTKLDNGALPLSEETAHTVSLETGVSMHWLLEGNPAEEPYNFDFDGHKQPYLKEHFGRIQSQKGKVTRFPDNPAWHFVVSTVAANEWHSVYVAAEKAGRGGLAIYRLRKFLRGLVAEMGKDDEEFLRLNADAQLTTADGSQWKWASTKDLEIEGAGGVLLQKVGGPPPVQRPRRKPAVTIPYLDVPHDSDGNTDWK